MIQLLYHFIINSQLLIQVYFVGKLLGKPLLEILSNLFINIL